MAADRQALQQRLKDLTPSQRLVLIEAMRAKSGSHLSRIPRYVHREAIAQSYTQRRLWFLFRITPRSAMYNMPECARLHGQIDMESFNAAFNDVLDRHSSLRTTFADAAAGPVQRISGSLNLQVEVIDWPTQGEPEELDVQVAPLLSEISNRSFDLTRGPLVSMTLMRVSPELHYLVVNMHHVVSDGWSTGIFVRDFSEFYRARLEQREARLPLLPIEFSDFVCWQYERMSSAKLQSLREFWRERLTGVEPLKLPFDRAPNSAVSERGGYRHIHINAETSARIKALASEWRATLFMALLAVFKGLLHRYSTQEDIAVGVPVAGRTHPDTENLIGFFANTAVIRTQLTGELSFKQLTARVRDSSLDAFEHEETPFEMLVEMLQPARSPGRNPLFQVMFILQNTKKPALSLPGIDIKLIPTGSTSVKFDMLFELAEIDEGITGWLGYRMDLFNEDTMTQFSEAFKQLLRGACEAPDKPLNQIEISSPAHEGLDAFNDDLDILPSLSHSVGR